MDCTEKDLLSLGLCVKTGCGTHPALPMSTGCQFHGGKMKLSHEADNSLPSHAKVNEEWSYTSTCLTCQHRHGAY